MGLRRLSLLVAIAACAAIALVPSAGAGNFDEQRMGCAGENPGICASGTTGQPYRLQFLLQDDEDLNCALFKVPSSGAIPPGLSVSPAGLMTGTPTQAGTFDFYATVDYPGCGKPASDDTFRISINPGSPKLTLGPELTTPATTGAPYSLQMTANVPDAKTWSITAGALAPGLALDASSGLISGTPTTAGTYAFTILAKVNADSRSDTKALQIVVRSPIALLASEPFSGTRRAQGEVSLPFDATITASGGTGTFTWTLTSGTLPAGTTFSSGAITGTPTTAGTYVFIASVTDTEGRVATYPATVVVAEKLTISTLALRAGRVGRLYAARLRTLGGVKPATWRIALGPLPRGIRFDRVLGKLSGTPKKPGTYRVTVEATDSLGVVVTKRFRIDILAARR